MEIEHHKWPSIKDLKSRMAKPWGFSILYWRSRVVFNPLSTSDDLINNIVVNSRNFNQACYSISVISVTKQAEYCLKIDQKSYQFNFTSFGWDLKIAKKNSWNHLSIINESFMIERSSLKNSWNDLSIINESFMIERSVSRIFQ